MQKVADPFDELPGIPRDWTLLRGLVRLIVGLSFAVGPSILLNEVVGPLWANVPWSVFATFGLPLLIAGAGLQVRRRWSRTAGTLLIAGAAVHFVGWSVVLVYAFWLTRGL